LGLDVLNLITTTGSYIFAAGFLVFLVNIFISHRRGILAGPNPWDAATLEWTTPSPPPPYNYVVIPVLASRTPLWESRLQESSYRSELGKGIPVDHEKEALATSTLDAEPEAILRMPEDSILPLLLALALTALFAGLIAKAWVLVIASLIAGLAFQLIWLWPRAELAERRPS
jgi:hypothetical protein